MPTKISFKLNKDKFSDLVSKLQDLTNIEDIIKLKIDKNDILMYSMLSNDVSVLALKSYLVDTNDYIDNFDPESDITFNYIITGASKFVKNLKFFNTDNPIKLDIIYKESTDNENIVNVRSSLYSNSKLKITCIGGESSKIRDINKNTFESKINPKESKWGFEINKTDFADVKKLTSINSEDKIINVNVVDGKVSMSEDTKWELDIDNITAKNTQLIFNKKYLSNINADNEIIKFLIFETFILVKDDNSSLILSYEQNFSTDD